MGVDEKLCPLVEDSIKEEENIFIIYINRDFISISNELKRKNSIRNSLKKMDIM